LGYIFGSLYLHPQNKLFIEVNLRGKLLYIKYPGEKSQIQLNHNSQKTSLKCSVVWGLWGGTREWDRDVMRISRSPLFPVPLA